MKSPDKLSKTFLGRSGPHFAKETLTNHITGTRLLPPQDVDYFDYII